MNAKDIRKKMRHERRLLSIEKQKEESERLLNQFKQSGILSENTKIALYLANDGEVNPQQLQAYLWSINLKTYLPVLHPFSKGHLSFFEHDAKTPMVANQYNIMEPSLNCTTICPVDELDIVLMPLVAFDHKKNRLGMGGGFYDRTFANKRSDQLLVGLAHNCQQVACLPVQKWDVPLDMVITPKIVIK